MDSYAEIIRALRQLGTLGNGMIPSKIVGEPNHQDAADIIKDLAVIARHVDAVIEAYGAYVKDFVNIGADEFRDNFHEQTIRKLQDGAFFTIENAINEHQEMLVEEFQSHHRSRLVK